MTNSIKDTNHLHLAATGEHAVGAGSLAQSSDINPVGSALTLSSADASSVSDTRSPTEEQRRFHLLIAEDDQLVSMYLCRIISQKFPDLVICLAESGMQGVELFKMHRPVIVVTGINMPFMDGIQMTRIIRALDASVNIIAITSKTDTEYLMEAIEIGINHYLLKPIDTKALCNAMDDCMNRITWKQRINLQNEFIHKLSRAVEQSTNTVMIISARGTIEYVNSKFTEVTGYAPEEVIGQNLRTRMTDAASFDTFEILWSTINRGLEWHGEFANRKKDGECYCEGISISPLLSEEGEITHFVVVMQDISERKQCEKKIRHMNEELVQRVRERTSELEASNKELEAFCYAVAHDLRTPLRGISGFSNVLLEDHCHQLDEAGKKHLLRIGSVAGRMGHLIDDLLKLSQVTRSKLRSEKVDLSALACEIRRALEEQEPERRVEMVIPARIEADGDPILIRLVLDNLLGNAWKYTGKQAQAKVELGKTAIDGEPVYYVRDNGIGFDMAYVSKIFAPFQRLHRVGEFEGNGIGLATVQRIVTRHGGRVWAEGEVDKGATFYFTLRPPLDYGDTLSEEKVA